MRRLLPLSEHLPLLLVGIVAGLCLTGCSTSGDTQGDGSEAASTPASSTAEASETAPTSAGPDGQRTGAKDAPRGVAAVCASYAGVVEAVRGVMTSATDPGDVAATLAPLLKEFAGEVLDLERPPGLDSSTWRSVHALAAQVATLPARPTRAEIEAIEGQLTVAQWSEIRAAAGWLEERCGL